MKQGQSEVFKYQHYKDFLSALSASARPGFLSRLAEAAGCQRSYLSDVLHREVNLTPDHAFGMAEFLHLDAAATEYFMDLVAHARAGSKAYKDCIARRLAEARRSHLNLTSRLQPAQSRMPDIRHDLYYSSWHYGAIHVATSVAALSTSKQLAARLRLPESATQEILKHLVDQGLVTQSGNHFSYNGGRPEPFLPEHSVFSRMNHSNWRTLAMTQPVTGGDSVHYSSVFTVDQSDYLVLKTELMSFIEAQRATIAASGAEEVVVFCCDLFQP